MAIRQARSLDVLLAEINKFAPNRNKASDGGLGDPRHAAGVSDHNPNSNDVWTARDFTNDPRTGAVGGDDLPGQYLANKLNAMFGKHPAMGSGSYIIFNGRIKSFNRRKEGWRRYDGVNAHRTHVHLSVSDAAAGYDSKKPWNLFDQPPTRVERMHSFIMEAISEGRAVSPKRVVVKDCTRDLVEVKGRLPDK